MDKYWNDQAGKLNKALLDNPQALVLHYVRTAPPEAPVIVLALGNQPALPLSRLDGMDDRQLKDLLEKMKDTPSKDDEQGESADEAEAVVGLRDPWAGSPGYTAVRISHTDMLSPLQLLFLREWRRATPLMAPPEKRKR